MARVFVLCRNAKRTNNIFAGSISRATFATTSNVSGKRKMLYAGLGMAAAGGLGLIVALERSVKAADQVVHPQELPWPHAGWLDSFDINSVRRGYFVYKNVCSACHTISLWRYRHFVDQFMTDAEARAEAAATMVEDGPDDEGKMFKRPGKLNDLLPRPYANNTIAKLANNMALPVDLALITLGRHGGEDYIFSLLTGYQEPPAGITLAPGQAYNPYFPNGSVLSMAQQLFDEMLDYPDGTPATQSQMAKDVSTFLKFLSEPELDDRKKWAFKTLVFLIPLTFLTLYYKKFYWTTLKSQKWFFKERKGKS